MKLIDQVDLINIDKLIEYVQNPKKHPESQINKVASSIKKYGFTVPIIIDKDNEIIAGHARYKASRKLGLDKVPVIKRADLSDAEVRSFRLADNKVSQSAWDEEILAVELEELQELEEINIDDTGFSVTEVESITAFNSVVNKSSNTKSKAKSNPDLNNNNDADKLTADKFEEEIRDFEEEHGKSDDKQEEHWIWCETEPQHSWILKEIHNRYGLNNSTSKLDPFKLAMALGIIDESYIEEEVKED